MTGAIFSMAVNVGIALLFAGSFATLALAFRAQRQALWFALAFSVGALTPISEMLVRLTRYPDLFSATSYGTSLAAMLLIGYGFARFCGGPREIGIPLTLYVTGVALRVATWGGPRSTMPYELIYQLPLALACIWTTSLMLRTARPVLLHRLIACYFLVMASSFVAKAFISVRIGSGATAKDYASSTYALISQAGTGVLMIGVGMLILLVLIKDVTDRSRGEAETDALTGIANRRGFDRRAKLALHQPPAVLVLFDLDLFKTINDTHGHDVGDRVIVGFAEVLKRHAPSAALLARTGGEEFAMLIEKSGLEPGWLSAEAVRVAVIAEREGGSPIISVSGGVAEWRGGEPLIELMRRADQALYRAKAEGRNRIVRADA